MAATNIHTDQELPPQVAEDFSPKKFILQGRQGMLYIFSKWKIILAFALLCGIAGAAVNSFKKNLYIAETTFALDEGAAQSARTEYSQLTEQLGMGAMLDAGGVFSSVTNIVELMQSRLMIEKTLRKPVVIYGKPILFADFFLDSLQYRKKWMTNKTDSAVNFKPGKKKLADSLEENSIIRSIYETLLIKNIKIDKKGKGTSIISVTCISENELFSKYFLDALIQEVTAYYIETKTKRAKTNVEFLQHRTDSLRDAFSSSLYNRASFSDAHINPIRQIAAVPGEKQQTDVQIIRTTYMDLVRSLESAKTTLMRETPLIQYIDIPILPLKVAGSAAFLKSFLVFFFIGIFLITCMLFVYKVYRHILQN